MEELDGYEFDFRIGSSFHSSPDVFYLAGLDEVGRGPLAGPVVAAAVILPPEPRIVGLRDSKIVPPEQREALYCEIQETALAVEVAVIEHTIIDSINILEASMLAMRQCAQALQIKPHLVVVDGNRKPGSGFIEQAIIKGDGLSASIMAASIIAKVTRDAIMEELHERYPVYGFDTHKGYGCEQHLEAIRQFGPCEIHRRSFEPIKSLK